MSAQKEIGVRPLLSICMATFRRGAYIAETLDSLVHQLRSNVELVIVDGASPDNTQETVRRYVGKYENIRYFREEMNSGIDADYDKAVGYARGEYCWLMTDDDLLKPNAVDRVLEAISGQVELVVVNSEVRTADFSRVLSAGILPLTGAVKYEEKDSERFFSEVTGYLSFIGGVVIKRRAWLERNRSDYYGTLFVHVGVIHQKLIKSATVIRDPLIVIRYGNAMWTPRGFEIWMHKWPNLVWSFRSYSEEAKSRVCAKEPWRQLKNLVLYRALGGYGKAEYMKFVAEKAGWSGRIIGYAMAYFPIGLLNSIASIYCAFINKNARSGLYDLARSRHATWLSRYLLRYI